MVRQLLEPARRNLAARAPFSRRRFEDARKADRLSLALRVVYTVELPDKRLEGHTTTIDISSAGVQLTLPDMVSPQTPCQLDIALPGHPDPLSFRGRVAWCRLGRGRNRNMYETGIAFIRPSTYTDPTFALFCRFIATKLFRQHLSR